MQLRDGAADVHRALLAAALALPGIAATHARAQAAPDTGVVSMRVLDYRDWQPGADRMRVRSTLLRVLYPVSADWAVDAFYTTDSMSGASPLYHDTLSGASGRGVRDFRRAGDVRITRYFERGSLSVGGSASSENDYLSRAARIEARIESEDRNTALALGFGGSSDRIDSENGVATGERRRVREFLLGVTRVLTPTLIAQVNLTYGRAAGYFSDPYKPLDQRPDTREQLALLSRANWFLPGANAALRVAYRFYRDTWQVRAHTVEAVWDQGLPDGWRVIPGVRYSTQSAAYFYRDPPFGVGFVLGQPYSADQRLSAFGTASVSLMIVKALAGGWTLDAKGEVYRARQDWRPGGGSAELAPFSARTISLGVSRTF